jgi:hypothetical protein
MGKFITANVRFARALCRRGICGRRFPLARRQPTPRSSQTNLEETTMSITNPPIPDYRIIDFNSFKEVTEKPRTIAGLYFYQLLDCLVDLAYDVSADFRNRPEQYQHLGDPKTALTLARLNAKYGTEIDFLSGAQRSAIYLPIFGSWDSSTPIVSDSFPQLRDDLIRAATAFAERTVDTSIEFLREAVRHAHRPFKDYLVDLQGDSVIFSKDTALQDLTETNSYPILRDPGVADVFNVHFLKHAADAYPYATNGLENRLAEEISKRLPSTDKTQHYITRERISNLQQAALRGAEAIATAIDFDEHDKTQTTKDLDLLISKCYTWGTALQSLSGPIKPLQSGMQPAPGTQPVPAPPPATSTMAPAGYRQ